ncbi:hypothetical protein RRG08_056039 [Elysia crispata]|uniref:Uncharacterized protein n=1 Tax=Elysia crispata TaxID=231223 RepID=A0AAE1DY58_9GAST|nr:hypothetical protein RRG08_056039 [Elysia crispata]
MPARESKGGRGHPGPGSWQLVHEASPIDSSSGLQDPWELCPAPTMRVSGPLCQAATTTRLPQAPSALVWEG